MFFVAAENAEGWNKDRNHFLVRTLARAKGELFVWGRADNNQLSLLPEELQEENAYNSDAGALIMPLKVPAMKDCV